MKTGLFADRDAATKLSAMVMAVVFICLIALQGYVFWKSLQSVKAPPTTKPILANNSNQGAFDIGRLAATHLFGDVEKTVPQDSEVKEDKSLNLTLRGIVANSGGNTSLAIIESKPGGEETFAPGDTVFNKGRLNSIAVDHVILVRNDGRLARLQLPEQESIDTNNNEDYLPQAQPTYVEPEAPQPEQSGDSSPGPEPAIAVQAKPETPAPEENSGNNTATEPAAAVSTEPGDQNQPETSSEPTTTDESTGVNQNTTPAQP